MLDGYASWSVIYGETPSAAKWNILGTNDSTFDTALGTGWLEAAETWTYASASTFTISGDYTTVYQKGDKIRLKQGASYKYFYITNISYGAPNTTVTVNGGTTYTVANSAITDNAWSNVVEPFGFPAGFDLANRQHLTIHGRHMTIRGWDYVNGDGAAWGAGRTVAPTFGVTFAEAPSVTANYHSYLDGSNPTALADAVTNDPTMAMGFSDLSTTSVEIGIHHYADTNTANNRRYIIVWKADGKL